MCPKKKNKGGGKGNKGGKGTRRTVEAVGDQPPQSGFMFSPIGMISDEMPVPWATIPTCASSVDPLDDRESEAKALAIQQDHGESETGSPWF